MLLGRWDLEPERMPSADRQDGIAQREGFYYDTKNVRFDIDT